MSRFGSFITAAAALLHATARSFVLSAENVDQAQSRLNLMRQLPRTGHRPKLTGNRAQRARQMNGFLAMGGSRF